MRLILLRFLLFVAGLIAALAAFAARADAPSAPTLYWHDASGGTRAAVALDLSLDYTVSGLVAEAALRQRFRNDGPDAVEARYLLPLPEGAAVHRLRLVVGERVIEGELREKEEAAASYRAAADAGRRASLVERAPGNRFRTAVANVGPGETLTVELGFWQPVRYRDGRFLLTFPLTYVPAYAQGLAAAEDAPSPAPAATASAPPPRVAIGIDLDPGLPLRAVESMAHAIDVRREGRRFRVRLVDETVPADRDFELAWMPEPAAAPRGALFVEPGPDADYALLMLVPPSVDAVPLPRELVLVIDTSGSMHGGAIAQARAAVDGALARLRPGDRFNVIRFHTITEPLFQAPVAADDRTVTLAREWVQTLDADGGTEMLPALDAALAGAPPEGFVRQVVFATDGAVTEEDLLYTVIERQLGAARLFPIGIGDAPNAHFLAQAARMGRGAPTVIRDLGDVAQRLDELFGKLDRPALTGLELIWPGPAETYPAALPDLYQGEPLLAVARLERATGELVARGLQREAPWSTTLALTRGARQGGIARLWARHKVDAFEDALRRGADESALRPEYLAHALTHSLVTRYTSLVAVDRTASATATAPPHPVDVANGGDALGLAATGTGARGFLAAGLAGLMLLIVAARWGRPKAVRA